jgi:hypothetical protein
MVLQCINGVGSNSVEGRTTIWQLKNLILTLFGLIFRRIYVSQTILIFRSIQIREHDTCNIGLKTENEDKQNTTKKAQKMSNTDPNIKRAVTGGARERKLVLFSYSFTHSRVFVLLYWPFVLLYWPFVLLYWPFVLLYWPFVLLDL